MQQKEAIPPGYSQILAMEKFEDRPMSSVFELYPSTPIPKNY